MLDLVLHFERGWRSLPFLWPEVSQKYEVPHNKGNQPPMQEPANMERNDEC